MRSRTPRRLQGVMRVVFIGAGPNGVKDAAGSRLSFRTLVAQAW
jgi:hypothetical protein